MQSGKQVGEVVSFDGAPRLRHRSPPICKLMQFPIPGPETDAPARQTNETPPNSIESFKRIARCASKVRGAPTWASNGVALGTNSIQTNRSRHQVHLDEQGLYTKGLDASNPGDKERCQARYLEESGWGRGKFRIWRRTSPSMSPATMQLPNARRARHQRGAPSSSINGDLTCVQCERRPER